MYFIKSNKFFHLFYNDNSGEAQEYLNQMYYEERDEAVRC